GGQGQGLRRPVGKLSRARRARAQARRAELSWAAAHETGKAPFEEATMSRDHDGGHHPEPLSPVEARARAIESLLIEKGLVSSDAIAQVAAASEKDSGPL